MESHWLYHTVLPVLLGEPLEARTAGTLAMRLFRRHGVVCIWFGRKPSLRLRLYARCYPVSPEELSDDMRVRALLDFARDPARRGLLLALIPCSKQAEAFLIRYHTRLECAYVFLPGNVSDPLGSLIMEDKTADPLHLTRREAVRT